MAIPCPGCGREYDVTLFQFGSTIHLVHTKRMRAVLVRLFRGAGHADE